MKSEKKPTVFFREFLLSLWCRQQALIHLLEEKNILSEVEYVEELRKELEDLLQHFYQ